MPGFSFTTPIKKPKGTRKNYAKSSIILENVIGIVHIDLNAKFYVQVDAAQYDITDDSYDCSKHKYVFRNGCAYFDRLIVVRDKVSMIELNHKYYTPFSAGCSVIGDVINGVSGIKFKIKKIDVRFLTQEAKDAYHFLKDNIKTINEIFYNRQNGNE